MKKQDIIFQLIVALVLICSCKRSKEMLGPEYISAPSDFYVAGNTLQANTSSINFESAVVYFTSDFSSRVNWFLSIKGVQSGASKKFSGLSDQLSAENTTWNGSHDGEIYFRMNEQAIAELTFLGSELILRDTITIVRAKKYNTQGLVLADDAAVTSFEGYEGTYNFNKATWTYGVYSDAGEMIYGGIDSSFTTIQGTKMLTLHGNDLDQNFFIGGLKRVLTVGEYNSIPEAADSVYVNLYLYGTGNTNSYVNFTFEENDLGQPGHVGAQDDAYEYQFNVSHSGWKLFSLKYSQLNRATNPNYGGSGNGVREPHKLRNVALNLISSPAGNISKVSIDMPIITFGKPFNPNE